jgi:hypothetical protein
MIKKIVASNDTLKSIIKKEIKKHGLSCDLNHIDTSKPTDMIGMINEY